MGRVSTKKDKKIYQTIREELGLTREKASELLGAVPPERIEKIENEKSVAHPDEVLLMAEKYCHPELCNYYCANECPIGRQYVPEVKVKHLSQIVLDILATINRLKDKQDRLVEISVDGKIKKDEISDFIHIQGDLERLSIAIESLQLWTERKLAHGEIDPAAYKSHKES